MKNLIRIGSSDLLVAPIGFGTMHFGVTVDLSEAKTLLDEYAQVQGAFLDTANIYSRHNLAGPFHEKGQSEQFIGDWLATSGKRARIILATKVKNDMGDGFSGLSKKSILHQVDQSLKRLKTDYIDLYQLHGFDREVPVEETLDALSEIVKAGKARYIGCCNIHYEQIKEYQDKAEKFKFEKIISYQNPYNLIIKHRLRNEYGNFLLTEQEAKELGVKLICYRSLVNGFLAGKYQQGRSYRMVSEAQKAVERNCFNENGWQLLDVLNELAEKSNSSLMQITLAAYRHDPKIGVSLVGFSKSKQIREAVKSLDIQLSDSDLLRIDLASQRFKF